jgi:hypothetical protein
MKHRTFAVTVLAVLGTAVTAQAQGRSQAQAPCAVAAAVVDSAREDALSVLASDRPLVVELRQEQKMTQASDLKSVAVVNERYVCAKMAGAFDHIVAPGVSFAVLRIGPIYYARDPDQRRGTGVFTDTAFKVLMRLGAVSPGGN